MRVLAAKSYLKKRRSFVTDPETIAPEDNNVSWELVKYIYNEIILVLRTLSSM